MRPCLIFAAAGLTAMFVSLPLSLSSSPSSSWPQLTVSKANAFVTYRRARVATRRAYRRDYRYARRAYRYGAYHGARPYHHGPAYVAAARPAFYGYPYTAPNYAYRHVYAAPAGIGWGWGHRWGRGFGWGWHRGWRW